MNARSGSGWLSLAVLLAALALLLSLGTWQLQRRTWKNDLLATIEQRTALTPVTRLPLDECRPDLALADPCHYLPVAIDVVFDHALERHVFISVPLQRDGVGGPGYWVFTWARTADGRSIFINRGFVPEAKKDQATRFTGLGTAQITMTGVLRQAEQRGLFSAANDPDRNVYFVRSPTEFIACTKEPCSKPDPAFFRALSTHYYIDQTGPPSPGGLPRPMVGRIAIPNRHLEYALTWYALAATLLGVAFFYRRGRRAVNDG
jgi:surfeit locus 1 family protein